MLKKSYDTWKYIFSKEDVAAQFLNIVSVPVWKAFLVSWVLIFKKIFIGWF